MAAWAVIFIALAARCVSRGVFGLDYICVVFRDGIRHRIRHFHGGELRRILQRPIIVWSGGFFLLARCRQSAARRKHSEKKNNCQKQRRSPQGTTCSLLLFRLFHCFFFLFILLTRFLQQKSKSSGHREVSALVWLAQEVFYDILEVHGR